MHPAVSGSLGWCSKLKITIDTWRWSLMLSSLFGARGSRAAMPQVQLEYQVSLEPRNSGACCELTIRGNCCHRLGIDATCLHVVRPIIVVVQVRGHER
ncbi:hypothetical protein BJX62DRAFT_106958 [Aspergillus germanicus]